MAGGAQQPPFGAPGATGPSPNLGYEAAGLQKLGLVVRQLEQLIPLLGATTDPGKAVLDALKNLVKWVPAGSVTPAAERNNIEQMMMQNTANNQQVQALRSAGMQGGGAPPGQMPGRPPSPQGMVQ